LFQIIALTKQELQAHNNSLLIKKIAISEGFDFVGISKATELTKEAKHLENWLNRGMHGQMHYMEKNFDLRIDPRKLVPGAKSVVSLLFNYYSNQIQTDCTAPKISKYAYGEDYHFVVKSKLNAMFLKIKEQIGEIEGRVFIDSAPVLDKAWAQKSGLGWIGKNSNLINKKSGSFFFIAALIIDLELEPDGPVKDYCGTCKRCIEACPTDAIVDNHIVDGSKCISYFTIELKDALPANMNSNFENWMFGCDICQDVCPWNRFSKPNKEMAFQPKKELLEMNKQEWIELTEETFNFIFKNSAVQRTKYQGLKRNITFLNDTENMLDK